MDASAEATGESSARPLWWKVLLVVGLAVCLLAVLTVWTVCRPTGDLYVALAAGRDIVHGKLAQLDDWAFTTPGRVWVNQNWGTHLAYYGFYRAFGGQDGNLTGGLPDGEDPGEIGLVVLKLLMLLTGATFLTITCHRRGVDWPIALIVSGVTLAAARSFIDLRPNLTTLMFVPVMLFLLHRTLDRRRGIWLAMVIFGVVWANLHGGFIFGLAVMLGWAGCMLGPAMVGERWLRRWIPGLACSAGAGVVGAIWLDSPLVGVVVFLVFTAVHWLIAESRSKKTPKGQRAEDASAALGARIVGAVRDGWPYAVGALGAIVLAGVVTPFGIHNAFRDYSSLKMSFMEIWNVTHPFVIMAGPDSDLWQSVIEWHSIFTASPRTFGTSWEFLTIVGVFGALVSLHGTVKLVRRRAVDPEDVVLLVGVVVLSVAVVDRAYPVWDKFAQWVRYFSQSPAGKLQLAGVLEQRHAWMAALVLFPCIGLFAFGVLVAVGLRALGGQRLERFGVRRVGMMIFEVVMATGGVYLAFGARRFMPLSLILLCPLLARRVQWLLGELVALQCWRDLFVRVVWWALLSAATVMGAVVVQFPELSSWLFGRGGPGIGEGMLIALPLLILWGWTLMTRWVPSLRPAWPGMVLGVAIFGLVSVQARTNLMRYLPFSPVVRHRSMLRNMIVYPMFPPGCRDFLCDNKLSGRMFNEWRWEGYLRWYRPELKSFVGGRAQQAYDVETYKVQRRIINGRETPAILAEMKVRWIVVPMNPGYTKLLQMGVYSDAGTWVPIYCDGENIVLANALLPECVAAIDGCLKGTLTYRSEALAALSKGFCLSARTLGKRQVELVRRKRALTAVEAKAIRQEVARRAVKAIKLSQRLPQPWPVYQSYSALGDLFKILPVDTKAEAVYFEADYKRLLAMDTRRPGGVEVLRCRQWVANLLANLYRAEKDRAKFEWARAELATVARRVDEMLARWR